MTTNLDAKRFGFAIGITSALAYAGCVVIMYTVPHEASIWFFNSLTHGLDVEPMVRWDIPWWESAIGLFETLVLGSILGTICAAIYNRSISNYGHLNVEGESHE